MSEAEALRRYARTGDPEAFRQLVEAYGRMVYATCVRLLGRHADAEDATQETFLKLARHASRIRTSIAGWLHAAATSTCHDLMRKQGRQRAHEAQTPPPATSEDAITAHELREALDAALAELPERDRDLVVKRYLIGRSLQEIAAEAGISEPSMSRRVSKALDALRERLAVKGVTAGAATLASLMQEEAQAAVPEMVTASLAGIGVSGVGVKAAGAFGLGKWLTAAMAVLVAAGGVVWFTAPNGVAPAARLPQTTIHLLGENPLRPDDRAESWYDPAQGVRDEMRSGGQTRIRIDNGTHEWRHTAGEPTATRLPTTYFAGRLLGDLLQTERFRQRAQVERTADGREVLTRETTRDGQPVERQVLELNADGWPVLYQEYRWANEAWVLEERLAMEYDVPIDPALFRPEFGESVRIVDHTDAPRAFDLEHAKLVQPIEDLGLIFAVHDVRRLSDGAVLVIHTTRGTPETIAEVGPLPDNGQSAYGMVQLYPMTQRRLDGRDASLHPMGLASWRHNAIDYAWTILVPRNWPVEEKRWPLDVHLTARGAWEQKLEEQGREWWRVQRAFVTVDVPDEVISLDEAAILVYEQCSRLAQASWGAGPFMAMEKRAYTDAEKAREIAAGRLSEEMRDREVTIQPSGTPRDTSLDRWRQAVRTEYERVRAAQEE